MRNSIRVGLLATATLLLLISCGRTPIYRWHAGSPTSFAFADGELVPVEASTQNRTTSSRAIDAGTVPQKDYGRLNITFRNDSTDHRAHYESLGTFIGAYTPDSFPVSMVKVAALKSNSDEGFWILQTNEGVFGEMEFLDFKDPVFIEDNLLWQPGDYETLIVRFSPGGYEIGAETTIRPIRVTVPGYTDVEMPNLHYNQFKPVDGEWRHEYNGNNEFLLTLNEMSNPSGSNATTSFVFRSEILTGQVLMAEWWRYADGSCNPGATVISAEGYVLEGRVEENPERVPWYSGNTWFISQPYGDGGVVNHWADIPFQGLSIDEETQALEIVIRWDLDGVVELWDFDDAGLELVLAPDFMDRFSMEVRQIQ